MDIERQASRSRLLSTPVPRHSLSQRGSDHDAAMDFYAATLSELRDWATDRDLPAFRGQQIFDGLHRQTVTRFQDIRGLPGELAAQLDQTQQLCPAEEIRRQSSNDGTVKSLLRFQDGALAECVSIPTSKRHTICVSSQVGCPVGCTFCASGKDGVTRNLSAGEIVYQVLFHHQRKPVTNIVYMGSGEPLFNYDAVLKSIAVLADERGLGLGRRRFTVSTSGVCEKIRQLAEDEPQVTLALSLHAPDDETRSRIVPLNKKWPIEELMQAMDAYSNTVGRRITLEYVLLKHDNMSDQQAQQLQQLARRYGAHINLIPFNPVFDTPHQRPDNADIERFCAVLEAHGAHFTVRGQRGADIDAACGQLKERVE